MINYCEMLGWISLGHLRHLLCINYAFYLLKYGCNLPGRHPRRREM